MTETVPAAVHRTEIDGVPVLWVDNPGRLHAELVFGVGIADESYLVNGVTHLVEHLVMHAVGEDAHAANAGVGVSTTAFEVTSSPERVAGHLRRVCAAITDLDLDRLERERRVITSEEETYGSDPLTAVPLGLRFGVRGPGLTGVSELAAHLMTPDAVRDWARRHLHRGNAVLVLDGPPPADLALPLPDGPPVSHPLPVPVASATPAWFELGYEGVLVAAHARASAEILTGLSVLTRRLTRRLRHEAGLVYEVGHDVTHLVDGTVTIGIGVGAPERDVPTVCEHLFDVLDELCSDGPTADDLARDRDELAEADADVAATAWSLAYERAVELLLGATTGEADRDRVRAGLEPRAVAVALRALRDSMVVGVPEDVDVPRLPRLAPTVPPVTARRTFPRAMLGSGLPRGARLLLADDGVTLDPGRGTDPVTVLFADLVGVGEEPGPKGDADVLLGLQSGRGDRITLRARDWRDGADAVAAVRAAVPAALFHPVPEHLRLTS